MWQKDNSRLCACHDEALPCRISGLREDSCPVSFPVRLLSPGLRGYMMMQADAQAAHCTSAGKPRRKQDLRMTTSIRVASGKRERAQPRRQEKPAGLPGQSPPAPHMVPSLYVSARSAQSHAERSHCPERSHEEEKNNSVLQRASIPSLSQMCNAGTCLHPLHVLAYFTGEYEAGERLPCSFFSYWSSRCPHPGGHTHI